MMIEQETYTDDSGEQTTVFAHGEINNQECVPPCFVGFHVDIAAGYFSVGIFEDGTTHMQTNFAVNDVPQILEDLRRTFDAAMLSLQAKLGEPVVPTAH